MISPSPRTPAADRRAGFSLIEVVAVMLIIALVASLAVTMMPGTGRGRLKALALETAALLRRERLGAVMTGQERRVSVDGEQRVSSGMAAMLLRFRATSCSTFSVSTHCGRGARRWCDSIRMARRPERC